MTKSNGTSIRSTRRQSSYDQLILGAIRGDRAGRAEMLQRVFELSRKDLLSAPKSARRMKRMLLSKEYRDLLAKALVLIAERMSREMTTLFASNPGSNTVITDYEHEAREVNASRAKRRHPKRLYLEGGAADDTSELTTAPASSGPTQVRLVCRKARSTSKQTRLIEKAVGCSLPARKSKRRDRSPPGKPTQARTKEIPAERSERALPSKRAPRASSSLPKQQAKVAAEGNPGATIPKASGSKRKAKSL